MVWRIVSDLVCVVIGAIIGTAIKIHSFKKEAQALIEEQLKKQLESGEEDPWID